MDNIRGLLSIRRMDRVAKGVDERILHWFSNIAKRVVGKIYAGVLVDRVRNDRWFE